MPLPGWKSGCFPLTHKAKFEFLLHGMAVNFFDLEFTQLKHLSSSIVQATQTKVK